MRDIKFKAKRKDWMATHDSIKDWVRGYYVQGKNPDNTEEKWHFIFEYNEYSRGSVSADQFTRHRVDPVTVCQYTERNDVLGCEIYEHDKIGFMTVNYSNIESTGEVILHRGCWSVKDDANGDIFTLNQCQTVEVIGNIHDTEDRHGNQ